MMAALMGGDDITSSVLFPSWTCNSTTEGDLDLDMTVYVAGEDPATTLQIGKAFGLSATEPTTIVVNGLVGDVVPGPYETGYTLTEAQQYSWFVRYLDIGGGTADTEWFEFAVTDPGCGESGGSGGGGGGGDIILE